MSQERVSFPGSLLFDLANRPPNDCLGLLVGIRQVTSESVITDAREGETRVSEVTHVQHCRSLPSYLSETDCYKGNNFEHWLNNCVMPNLGPEQLIIGVYFAKGTPPRLAHKLSIKEEAFCKAAIARAHRSLLVVTVQRFVSCQEREFSVKTRWLLGDFGGPLKLFPAKTTIPNLGPCREPLKYTLGQVPVLSTLSDKSAEQLADTLKHSVTGNDLEESCLSEMAALKLALERAKRRRDGLRDKLIDLRKDAGMQKEKIGFADLWKQLGGQPGVAEIDTKAVMTKTIEGKSNELMDATQNYKDWSSKRNARERKRPLQDLGESARTRDRSRSRSRSPVYGSRKRLFV